MGGSALRIAGLLALLVGLPLVTLAHFHMPLASLLGAFTERYLANPTLLQAERKRHHQTRNQLNKQRTAHAKRAADQGRLARKSHQAAHSKGRRILVRGAGATAVGWVPVLGLSADVASLAEDYADICGLYAAMDELLHALVDDADSLYKDNYCHLPEQGLLELQQAAEQMDFSWTGAENPPAR